MKLRRSLSEPEEPIELNLIPLIDVIMFLLIFFISTTTFMDMRGISVDKPQPGSASPSKNESIVLSVKSDGRVLYHGQQIGLDGVKSTVKRLCDKEHLPVVIQADQKAPSGLVIRVIDDAKLGGAKDVSLATDQS
jgi:biopolymer transport protein ExbD